MPLDKHVIKTGRQSESDPYKFVLSTSDVDRDGDVVVPDGISLKDFKKNPIALFSHNHNFPIGTWENLRVEGKRLVGDLFLAAAGTSKLVDEVRSLVEQRILKAVSIGFSVSDYTEIKQTGGYRFEKTELHEASLVAVPANQNALMVKGLSAESKALFFTDSKSSNPRAGSVSDQTPPGATFSQSIKGHKPMSIADRIKAKQGRKVAILDRMTELKAMAEGDDELTEDQQAEIEALTDEMTTVKGSIKSLESIEASLQATAEPVNKLARPGRVAGEAAPKNDGALLIKAAAVNFLAHIEKKSPAQIMKERYADDDQLSSVVKTAVAGADTTTAGWAAELVGESVVGFLDQLKPVSVYAQAAAMGLSIPFGNSGSIKVPARAGTILDLAGAFIGESGVIPVKQGAFSSITINRYKLGVMSVFSKELARSSTPQIETVLRQAMIDDTANALDNAFLDASAAVTGVRPAGIMAGITGTVSAGDTLDNIITDLRVLMESLASVNAGQKPVFMLNTARIIGLSTVTNATGSFVFRDEIGQGRIMGIPFIASTNVPSDEVMILDAAHLATAFGTPEIEASDVATLTMANADGTAPTQATDGAGALGTAEQVQPDSGISVAGGADSGVATAGYQAQSMFQTWQIAVRNVTPISWALMRAGIVDRITGVSW
ncbi:phage major capsid protein [Candidatus Falkowbacteria bacterium]|nr:MAG: phage major capsid protein [Candidatus Falkowbacteria bacterium]